MTPTRLKHLRDYARALTATTLALEHVVFDLAADSQEGLAEPRGQREQVAANLVEQVRLRVQALAKTLAEESAP